MIEGQKWRVKIRSPISRTYYTATVLVQEYRKTSESFILKIRWVKKFWLFKIEATVMTIIIQNRDIQWLERLK